MNLTLETSFSALDNSSLLKLASRASNLSERTLIVKELAEEKAKIAFTTQLDPFDSWKINKLAGKLAVQPFKESYEQGAISQSVIEDLRKLLVDYKLYELNLANLSESSRLKFIQPHSQWLKAYQAAMTTLALPKENFSESRWREPDIYYGKFAKVCEPFLRLLHERLQKTANAINASAKSLRINPQVIIDLELHLLNRFELAFAWAIEANINVYCSQKEIAKSETDSQAYIAYLEETFDHEQSYHRFYFQFPVLARWLAQVTDLLGNFGQETLQRLTNDQEQIGATFFNNKAIAEIKSFKLGKSDYHAGAKSVIIVELELANSEGVTLVYKPRSIKSEAGMQGLLAQLNQDQVVGFAHYQVLCRDGYGYAEFIPAGKNQVQNKQDIEKFYQQLGGFLSIFHALGGGDLHHENILVADGNAFICDCETVLEVLPQGMDKLPGTVLDSVFKTAMLDWPRDSSSPENSEMMSISGYSGGESYEVAFTIPKVKEKRMSLDQGVEYQTGITVELEGANRIYYNSKIVDPQDYKDSIVDGFNRVYNWFQQHPSQAVTVLKELFSSSLVRFINWGTQAYAKSLVAVRHPKCLANPLEVDLIFNSLKEHKRQWDKQGKLAELELGALWQLDIPIFTALAAESKDLMFNYQHLLPDTLRISPLDNAQRRIEQLSTENRRRQNQYIYTSLSTDEINSPHFRAAAVNYAQQIGWQLCEQLPSDSSKAPWQTWNYTATGKLLVDISGDLYDGSAGICLFLAYLDAIKPQAEFRQAAERALKYSIEKRNTTLIGAFQGETGLIYLLTHLAQLWDEPALLDLAVDLTDELLPRIKKDIYFDILHGVAGIIPVMLGLAEATGGKGIDCALQCAEHLLEQGIYRDNTLSWTPGRPDLARGNFTGFSHGASGIGWALIMLGCHSHKSEYIEAGRQAFAYEATQFDQEQRDWYDLRKSVMTADSNEPHFANAWCNGAAGIGLSRIISWAALGKTDDDLLRDAYAGLNATLRNFNKLGNDSLCHGKSGNAELFLRFAQLRNKPYLQMEANVQAQAQWRNFEKARRWMCGSTGNDIFNDLMLGVAGIGMHFLRLADQERVPSPLLLDPPAKVID